MPEAAEQSGRGRHSELRLAPRFEKAVRQAHQTRALALIPWEGETSLTLRTCLAQAQPVHWPTA